MCAGMTPDQTIISGSVRDSLRWAHQELVNRGKRHQRDSKRRANRCDTRGAGTAQSRAHSDFMAADLIHQFITGLPTEAGAR